MSDHFLLVLFENDDSKQTALPGQYQSLAQVLTAAGQARTQGQRVGVVHVVDAPKGGGPRMLYGPDDAIP